MILTLTANPSLDRTIELGAPLAHGAVQRAIGAVQDPGGKGVNISRALQVSGVPTLAIVPGEATDPVLTALQAVDVEFANLPTGEPIRSNITVVDPDGTTTKLNAPGTVFDAELRQKLDELVVERSKGADWVVLAGSLPPGLEPTYYSELVAALRASGYEGKIASDNWEELEASPELTARTAQKLLGDGIEYVLATLGGGGAVLVTEQGIWHAVHEPIQVRSTVGAGDSSLSGFLIAHTRGEDAPGCLVQAVAHGSAAAALPGTRMPSLEQTTPEKVTVRQLQL